jgi:hypothetical protein
MTKNRLTYKNNWESDEYYVNGEQVFDIKSVEINGRVLPVRKSKVSVTYSDHGHLYDAISDHFFIYTEADGIEFERDLNELCDTHKVYFLE